MPAKRKILSSLAAFLIVIAALLGVSLYLNDGRFIYVLDDPYIHMAIAKNFVTQGLWAVNGMTFSSATSSPLWSLTISAAYFISGVNVYAPFILNLLFSIAVIITAYKILLSFNAVKHVNVLMTVFILAVPLPALVFTGMEHTAQIFFALLFVYLSAELTHKNKNFVSVFVLVIISAVLTSLRYEDIFLVFSVSLIFALRKKYLGAVLVLTAGVLPIIIYGVISQSHGWMFLPNPILIKSRVAELTASGLLKIPFRAVKRMFEPDILFLIPPVIFVLYKSYKIKIREWNEKQIMFFIFLITYILHMVFAQTGWFFRYEAYLVSLGIIVLWLNIYDYLPLKQNISSGLSRLAFVIYAVMILSLSLRSTASFLVPQSSNNIYSQHYQMARFVNTPGLDGLPADTHIAANDIGMLNYYTPSYIVDLWGLADLDAAKWKLDNTYSTEKISLLARQKNVKLVMVYKDWFAQYGGLPGEWQKIGEWKMNQLNIVNGNEMVSFYSLDPAQTGRLKKQLADFSKTLPNTVLFNEY